MTAAESHFGEIDALDIGRPFMVDEARDTPQGALRAAISIEIALRCGQVPDVHPRLHEAVNAAARRLIQDGWRHTPSPTWEWGVRYAGNVGEEDVCATQLAAERLAQEGERWGDQVVRRPVVDWQVYPSASTPEEGQ